MWTQQRTLLNEPGQTEGHHKVTCKALSNRPPLSQTSPGKPELGYLTRVK